ncbi:MAG TPA: response regulator transcription factor [Anaerolineales bacterium]|nr:response regulator transcription factor [Anaerolineales bacterium]
MSKKIRVTILDDHQTIVDGYHHRLDRSPRVEIVATIHYGDLLGETLKKHPTDVLLLDVGVSASVENPNPYPILHVIPSLLQEYPDLAILVISMYAERNLIRAIMEAGASGYILKEDQAILRDLENVIVSVSSGGVHLSRQAKEALLRGGEAERGSVLARRQLEVLSLCLSYPDSSTAELARKMSISNSTVRNLLSGAYIKLGVHNRIAAVTKARQMGLISPESPTVPTASR